MHFFIRTTDKPGQPQIRQRLESEHRAWLERKAAAIAAAGPVLNDDGSDKGGGVYLIEADGPDAAEALPR